VLCAPLAVTLTHEIEAKILVGGLIDHDDAGLAIAALCDEDGIRITNRGTEFANGVVTGDCDRRLRRGIR
jgi:hypothetical protein